MGKRGPAPKGEFAGQSAVLSTRIRPDTRRHLEAASKASGRSLSQEIEFRLRRTFIEDERIADAFGSRANFIMARLIALALESSVNTDALMTDEPLPDWRNDPVRFDMSMRTVMALLEAYKPTKPLPPPSTKLVGQHRQFAPSQSAGRIVMAVQKADPSLPLSEGTPRQHFFGIAQAELGEIAFRPDVFFGTAEQIRQHIGEMRVSDANIERQTTIENEKPKSRRKRK
jgi:hypothetical protein